MNIAIVNPGVMGRRMAEPPIDAGHRLRLVRPSTSSSACEAQGGGHDDHPSMARALELQAGHDQ